MEIDLAMVKFFELFKELLLLRDGQHILRNFLKAFNKPFKGILLQSSKASKENSKNIISLSFSRILQILKHKLLIELLAISLNQLLSNNLLYLVLWVSISIFEKSLYKEV